MDTNLIAGRECGTCSVCCTQLTIDDPELQKLPGIPCHNLMEHGGCGIYQNRPHTCQTFYCAWRRLKWISADMRPDVSHVLVMVVKEPLPTPQSKDLAIGFLFFDKDALQAKGVAEAIAAAIQAGIGAYLLVPGAPGNAFQRVRLNERLVDAVRRKDKPSMLRTLRTMYRRARLEKSEPLVLTPRESPVNGLESAPGV